MGMKEKYIDIISSITTDGFKIIDKQDLLKDFMNDNDELLSATSWGRLVQYLGKKSFEISDLDEAYHFAIYTSYTNTVLEALSHYEIKINNLAIPKISKSIYPCIEFDINNFLNNKLIKYLQKNYKRIFLEEGIVEDNIKQLQKYINNNLKLNYFKLLKDNELVLSVYNQYVNSDIFKEKGNNFKKEMYKTSIEQEYLDIVLKDEKGLTLQDLYIEPYFRVHKNCLKDDNKKLENIYTRNDKFVNTKKVTIHKFIENFLDGVNDLDLKNNTINTIFISGYPGQGKSSFVKRFIYDAINNNISIDKDVIFIKLKNIQEPKDLLNNDIEETIKKEIPFEVEKLDNYILVLDGLDEIYMKSGLSISDIDTICSRISKISTITIITTRHHYVDFDRMNENNILILELKELDMFQQKKWLSKYKKVYSNIKLTDKIIDKLHSNKIKNRHILELINQPILLHMIASINIDKIEEYDKNKLYKEFFDILIERNWDKGQHSLYHGLEKSLYKKLLRKMLQELAINIFQSEYEYIHRIYFEELPSVKKFKKELERIQSPSVNDGLKGVMIAFYFQEAKKDGNDKDKKTLDENYAIEFLHKSLMEYMVAEYIWNNILRFIGVDSYSGEYTINENQEALKIIWHLFSPKILSHEVVNNLVKIIENYLNQDEKDKLANRLEFFMNYFLEKDFIYSYNLENKNPINKSISTFYGFWTILSHLNNTNKIFDANRKKLVILFRLLRNLHSEIFLNLSNCNLTGSNLSNMNFRHIDLSNTIFFNANLLNAEINNITCIDIQFHNTSLDYTDIWGLELGDNEIIESSFTYSTIVGLACYDVKIIDSIFENSVIIDSTFVNTKFIEVNFNEVLFKYTEEREECIFNDVEFIECSLINTIFKNVIFVNCPNIKSKEDLEQVGAIVIDCTFQNTK